MHEEVHKNVTDNTLFPVALDRVVGVEGSFNYVNILFVASYNCSRTKTCESINVI